MGFIYGMKSKYPRKCAENLLPNMLAQRQVRVHSDVYVHVHHVMWHIQSFLSLSCTPDHKSQSTHNVYSSHFCSSSKIGSELNLAGQVTKALHWNASHKSRSVRHSWAKSDQEYRYPHPQLYHYWLLIDVSIHNHVICAARQSSHDPGQARLAARAHVRTWHSMYTGTQWCLFTVMSIYRWCLLLYIGDVYLHVHQTCR